MMAQVELVKRLLGIADTQSDALLEQILASAAYRIMDYCNIDEVPEGLADVQAEIAVILYNRIGREGEASHSEGGVSIGYDKIFSEDIRCRLNAYRKPRW